MTHILEEIKKQPHHIRILFMWLSVGVAFTVVLVVWYAGTKAQIVGLVNPTLVRRHAVAMAEQKDSTSGLAAIGLGWSSFVANIETAFGAHGYEIVIEEPAPLVKPFPITPRNLPIAQTQDY